MARFLATLFLVSGLAQAAEPDFSKSVTPFRQLLTEMVKVDSTNPPGNEARVVEVVGRRLKENGIPFELIEFGSGRKNLIARIKGSGKASPLLLLAHTDVVGAGGQNWTSDPHEVVEKNGYLYGRGVLDDLGMAATEVEVFILLKDAKLKRDVILALTGDEESGGAGINHLLKHRPELVNATIALNEGGGIVLGPKGKPQRVEMQISEKHYQDFELSVEGVTGHSSVPVAENAIYRLSRALDKIGSYRPVTLLTPSTREYFGKRAQWEAPELKQAMLAVARSGKTVPESALKVIETDPALYADLHTTCVATLVSGGTRANALPAEAKANINCRILPEESIAQIQKRLATIVGDPKVKIKATDDFGAAKASPLTGEVPSAIAKVANQMWPGIPMLPTMSLGASDSRFLRNAGVASYGIQPVAMLREDSRRAHGIDERIPLASIQPAIEFIYRLVWELAAP